jgi:hypothetical protein
MRDLGQSAVRDGRSGAKRRGRKARRSLRRFCLNAGLARANASPPARRLCESGQATGENQYTSRSEGWPVAAGTSMAVATSLFIFDYLVLDKLSIFS